MIFWKKISKVIDNFRYLFSYDIIKNFIICDDTPTCFPYLKVLNILR